MFFLGVEKLVICSNLKMNCISQNQKESCYLCHKTLDIWIKTSIYLDGTEKPIMLCYNCAKWMIKDVDPGSPEHETRELLQDVREYPALRKCKEDSFLKKYFKILWVVFVLLVYLPVMIIGALGFCCKKYGYFTKPMKNITNRIFICHKQVNNDIKSNRYSLKRQ